MFLECHTSGGKRAFVGVEVKYHENLAGPAAAHRARYDEIAAMMGCFLPAASAALRRAPLQQLWRDHLLSGAMRVADGYDDAVFVVLYPTENEQCHRAVEAYRQTLSDSRSFDTWLLEPVLQFLAANTSSDWPRLVFDRYCDFSKLSGQTPIRVPASESEGIA